MSSSKQQTLSSLPSTAQQPPLLDNIQLIYAGGTFGSHGRPLQAIPANDFLPLLMANIKDSLQIPVAILPNECVKDSSQLTPSDFVHFYQLILAAYQQQCRQFVIITGTDTLSYLSAFLAEAFAGSDICVILTASMRPLFDAERLDEYVMDEHSDAWQNLKDAIGLAGYGESGVKVAFAGESWHAQTVQKIHSHDLMAFTGHHRAGYPANSYSKKLTPLRQQHWLSDQTSTTEDIVTKAKHVNIPLLFCLPNQQEWIATLLEQILEQTPPLPPTGIILTGFGAGNVPYSNKLANLLETTYQQGHMVVCTTQCPFGGVSDQYAAGSWQYDHHVLSSGRLTIAAIYARLLWLHLSLDTPKRRRQRWTYTINQTQAVRSRT